jgi:hypothetical protein
MITKIAAVGAVLALGVGAAGCSMSGDDESTTAAATADATTAATTAASGPVTSFGDGQVVIGIDAVVGSYTATFDGTCTVTMKDGGAGFSELDVASGNLETSADGETSIATITGPGNVTLGFPEGATLTSKGCGTWTAR